VPASVLEVLADVLDHVRRGEHVRVIADDEEITTQQAADLLNVSRPYLVDWSTGARSRPARSAPAVGSSWPTSSSTGMSTKHGASGPSAI
jgi:antitoxin (DNA-binding transcriptional repressor) of toxin-antitoxin stability system